MCSHLQRNLNQSLLLYNVLNHFKPVITFQTLYCKNHFNIVPLSSLYILLSPPWGFTVKTLHTFHTCYRSSPSWLKHLIVILLYSYVTPCYGHSPLPFHTSLGFNTFSILFSFRHLEYVIKMCHQSKRSLSPQPQLYSSPINYTS